MAEDRLDALVAVWSSLLDTIENSDDDTIFFVRNETYLQQGVYILDKGGADGCLHLLVNPILRWNSEGFLYLLRVRRLTFLL